jgi:cytidyltransferase-like protein
MVDMSVTLLHHGHIRLLKKAAEYGEVVVALATDKDIEKYKGHTPQLTWEFRKEIVESIRYVSEVVVAPYILTDAALDEHGVEFLVHGDDNFNTVSEDRLIIFSRTPAISSSMLLSYNHRIKSIPHTTDSDYVAKQFYETKPVNHSDTQRERRHNESSMGPVNLDAIQV